MVIVDNFSKYPELLKVTEKTADATIQAMKEVFARHGIPEKIVSDNMPFNSISFRAFANSWGVQIVTSSPTYA